MAVSSLVLGGLLALRFPSPVPVGVIMAIGAESIQAAPTNDEPCLLETSEVLVKPSSPRSPGKRARMRIPPYERKQPFVGHPSS